jgi:hypothetical protein
MAVIRPIAVIRSEKKRKISTFWSRLLSLLQPAEDSTAAGVAFADGTG